LQLTTRKNKNLKSKKHLRKNLNKKTSYKFFNKISIFDKHILFIKNNILIFFFFNNLNRTFLNIVRLMIFSNINLIYKFSLILLKNFKQTLGEGYVYARGLFIIFFIDASITDDEPI
jgi:hypothetical protein